MINFFTGNFIYMWIGSAAYSGWTNNNAVISGSTFLNGGYTNNARVDCTGGHFVPITILWIITDGSNPVMNLEIYYPNGTKIQNDARGYFFQPLSNDAYFYNDHQNAGDGYGEGLFPY